MKNASKNIDVFDEFSDDEQVRLQTRKKRRRGGFDNESEDRQRQSRKQAPRDFRKKRTRGDNWQDWIH